MKEQLVKDLPELADKYIQLCLNHTKEVATGSGKIVELRERHIPTISFFLNIWMPDNYSDTISRTAYYDWLRGDQGDEKQKLIHSIDEKFKALAIDIVANEQKGIFYAKNKLGMTDKQQTEASLTVQGLPIQINTNVPPLADNDVA